MPLPRALSRIYLFCLLFLMATAQLQHYNNKLNGHSASVRSVWMPKSNETEGLQIRVAQHRSNMMPQTTVSMEETLTNRISQGQSRKRESTVHVVPSVKPLKRPALRRPERSLMPLPPPPPGMQSLSPAVKEADSLEVENFWKNFPTLEKHVQFAEMSIDDDATNKNDTSEQFHIVPEKPPLDKLHVESAFKGTIADMLPVEQEPLEVELFRKRFESRKRKQKHGDKTKKYNSSGRSRLLFTTTTTIPSTTAINSTAEDGFSTTTSGTTTQLSTNVTSASVEAPTTNWHFASTTSVTPPAPKMLPAEIHTSTEGSSITFSRSKPFSPPPRLHVFPAGNTTPTRTMQLFRDPVVDKNGLRTPAPLIKSKRQQRTGQSRFRSAAFVPLSKTRTLSDPINRQSQPIISPRLRSFTRSNSLNEPGFPRVMTTIKNGNNPNFVRGGPPFLLPTKDFLTRSVRPVLRSKKRPRNVGSVQRRRIRSQRFIVAN
ncbi:hypothetical protein V3C99_013965 [Haemonchus contortus]